MDEEYTVCVDVMTDTLLNIYTYLLPVYIPLSLENYDRALTTTNKRETLLMGNATTRKIPASELTESVSLQTSTISLQTSTISSGIKIAINVIYSPLPFLPLFL